MTTYRQLIAARFAVDDTAVDDTALDDTALDDTGEGVNAATRSTLQLMLEHRSCRRFRDEPVDDELLELVLAAAFSTPSKSDLQQCSVIVVDDPGRRSAIAELIPSMPWIAEAARFLIFCGDSRRIRRIAERSDVPFANDHLDAVLNAAGDAAMHLSSFIWAAESVGLGTCPISVVRNHIDEVAEIVELPNHVFPFAGMCVGWPEQLRRLSPRLPPAVTIHRDCYSDADADVAIDDYDRRRANGYQPAPGQQLDVDRWGTADFYGWSTEKARMVGRRERDQLARFLQDRGFKLG
ncbi:MAG: nitroreductase family protein [Acidimicrobiales bacterium]